MDYDYDNLPFVPAFFAGDRVEYTGDYSSDLMGLTGTVVDHRHRNSVYVNFDGFQCERGVFPTSISRIAPPELQKFATAWLDKGELTYTGNSFSSEAEAAKFADAEVEANIDTHMVVVKLVSKHSSSVKVETEAL